MPERKQMQLKLAPAERSRMERAAKLDHLPLATWIRVAALGVADDRLSRRKTDWAKEPRHMLKKLGLS